MYKCWVIFMALVFFDYFLLVQGGRWLQSIRQYIRLFITLIMHASVNWILYTLKDPFLGIQFRLYEIIFKETTFVTFTWMNSLGEYFQRHWIMNERIRMFRVCILNTLLCYILLYIYLNEEKKSIFTNTNVYSIQSIYW